MQYKQIFDILNDENVHISLSTEENWSTFRQKQFYHKKNGFTHPKAIRKFASLKDRKKTQTNFDKEVKTSDERTVSKIYYNPGKAISYKKDNVYILNVLFCIFLLRLILFQ